MSIKKVATILEHMDQRKVSKLLSVLEEKDEALAQQLRDEMVRFTDLVLVNDRGLQRLLQEIDQASLVVALKGAEWALLSRILDNLSPRVAERLREELALIGPVRVQEIEAARKEIMQTARRLESRGALFFVGKRGADEIIL